MISFDSPLDIAAILAAPAEEKLAAVNAFHVHVNPTNTRDARCGCALFLQMFAAVRQHQHPTELTGVHP